MEYPKELRFKVNNIFGSEDIKSLFDYKIINENGRLGVEVFLKSKIINVSGFPFKAFVDDNVNQIVSAHVRMKN